MDIIFGSELHARSERLREETHALADYRRHKGETRALLRHLEPELAELLRRFSNATEGAFWSGVSVFVFGPAAALQREAHGDPERGALLDLLRRNLEAHGYHLGLGGAVSAVPREQAKVGS